MFSHLSSSRLDRQWIPFHTFFTFGLSVVRHVFLTQFDLVLHVSNKCSSSVASSPLPLALLSSDSQRKIESPQMLLFQRKDRHFSQLFHIPVVVILFCGLSYVEIMLRDYHYKLLEQFKTKIPQKASFKFKEIVLDVFKVLPLVFKKLESFQKSL